MKRLLMMTFLVVFTLPSQAFLGDDTDTMFCNLGAMVGEVKDEAEYQKCLEEQAETRRAMSDIDDRNGCVSEIREKKGAEYEPTWFELFLHYRKREGEEGYFFHGKCGLSDKEQLKGRVLVSDGITLDTYELGMKPRLPVSGFGSWECSSFTELSTSKELDETGKLKIHMMIAWVQGYLSGDPTRALTMNRAYRTEGVDLQPVMNYVHVYCTKYPEDRLVEAAEQYYIAIWNKLNPATKAAVEKEAQEFEKDGSLEYGWSRHLQ